MTDHLPEGFTTRDIMRRQLRREFWRVFGEYFALGIVIVAVIMLATWVVAR